MSDRRHTEVLRSEFERASENFSKRTKGRFDELDVVGFSKVDTGAKVLEIGAGTGNFLQLFGGVAGQLVGVDLTPAMLSKAREAFPEMGLIVGDGARLPLSSRSIDLVTTAQTLHHIWEPVPVLKEMRRVTAQNGRILIVDQVSTERYEEAIARNELEMIRDPSHASSRPASVLRTLVRVAGLGVIDERIVDAEHRFSDWMPPAEFPEARIEKAKAFIDEHGGATGMKFARVGDDYTFNGRRMMILAERA